MRRINPSRDSSRVLGWISSEPKSKPLALRNTHFENLIVDNKFFHRNHMKDCSLWRRPHRLQSLKKRKSCKDSKKCQDLKRLQRLQTVSRPERLILKQETQAAAKARSYGAAKNSPRMREASPPRGPAGRIEGTTTMGMTPNSRYPRRRCSPIWRRIWRRGTSCRRYRVWSAGL